MERHGFCQILFQKKDWKLIYGHKYSIYDDEALFLLFQMKVELMLQH